MIWKFKLKKFKTKPAFYEVRRLQFKIQKNKWERNRSVLDINPTRWADTVRYYWLRFYWEVYVKPDSHKTQRHEGQLKANGKSYFGASIHFSLMIKIKAPCRGEFRVFAGQSWSEVTVQVFLLIFHYTRFSKKRYPAKVSVK